MFRKIVHQIKSCALARRISKGSSGRTFVPVSEVRSMLVVLEQEDRERLVTIEQQFAGKKVRIDWVGYRKSDRIECDETIGFKQVTWSGKINNPTIQLILSQSYDLLLDITHEPENKLLEYLVSTAKASYKVGFTERESIDIVVKLDTEQSLETRVEELFKLLGDLKRY